MNGTPYIFGNMKAGYCQYPNDYTSEIFHDMFDQSMSEHQMVVHRADDLMYYAYISRLRSDGNSDKFIGLCMMLNGEMIVNIKELYPLFGDIVSDITQRGKLISVNDDGVISPQVNTLLDQIEETDYVLNSITRAFEAQVSAVLPLPPIEQTHALGIIRSFAFSEDNDKILKSTYQNSYTFLYKYRTGFHYSALVRSSADVKRKRRRARRIIGGIAVLALLGGSIFVQQSILRSEQLAKQTSGSSERKQEHKKTMKATNKYVVVTAPTFLYMLPDDEGIRLLNKNKQPIVLTDGTKLEYCYNTDEYVEVMYEGHRAYIRCNRCEIVNK